MKVGELSPKVQSQYMSAVVLGVCSFLVVTPLYTLPTLNVKPDHSKEEYSFFYSLSLCLSPIPSVLDLPRYQLPKLSDRHTRVWYHRARESGQSFQSVCS